MEKKTLTLFKKVFRPKLYEKEMRQQLLDLFNDLLDDNSKINERIEIINEYDVDDLLEKINKFGIKSLTPDELSFLDNQ
jgi:hypothetical protein